jgi:hypothetical protein
MITCRAHQTEEHQHATVALVRRHYQDPTVFLCGDFYELPGQYDEDGARIILTCTGIRWGIDEFGSHECEFGHRYFSMERRHHDGTEYAEDDVEAERLIRAGIEPIRA